MSNISCCGCYNIEKEKEPIFEQKTIKYKGKYKTYTINKNGETAIEIIFKKLIFFLCGSCNNSCIKTGNK